MSRQPLTADVLKLVQSKGVIVGSYTHSPHIAKDIDIVLQAPKEGQHPILQEIVKRWPEWIESGIVGHVMVRCMPINVELFAGDHFPLKDAMKNFNRLSYHQARRRAKCEPVYGVYMWVLNPEYEPNKKIKAAAKVA